ncbi:hypothetical protein [[Phormidium] sp. ETS-05]|uniref:hypothetical protein n=1 Tax=[Phormidium] sp. ETS-05 TaxID=222819 RepID=UPI0031FE7CF7
MDAGLRSLPIAAPRWQQFLVEKYSLALIPSVNLTDTSYSPLRWKFWRWERLNLRATPLPTRCRWRLTILPKIGRVRLF